MLLRALQVCQHFIAGRGLAFHGNWGPKAVVLPQAILLGLIHLCQDLITRFAGLRVIRVRRVSHLGGRGMDHAAGHGWANGRSKLQGGQEGANCHVYLLGFE